MGRSHIPLGARLAAKIDGRRRKQRGPLAIGHFDKAPGRVGLGILQNLLDRLHRGPPKVFFGVEHLAPFGPGAGRKNFVQQGDQCLGVERAVGGFLEAPVVDPFGMPGRSGQRGPMALALQTDDPEPFPFAVLVVVHGGVPHGLAVSGQDIHAETQAHRHIEAQCVHAFAQERSRNQLTLAGALALIERRADRPGGGQPRVVIPHPAALEGRGLAREHQRPRDARPGPEGRHVVGRPVGVGSLEAVARDRRIDEPGIAPAQGFRVQAQPRQGSGTHVAHEDVRAVDQLVG